MKKKTKTFYVLAATVLALLIGAAAVTAASLLAPTTTWNVTPISKTFPADRSCPTGSSLVQDVFQSVTEKLEGTYTYPTTIDGMPVTIEVTTYADNSFDFNIIGGVVPQMFVKGGAESGYLLYQYVPKVIGATNDGPVSYDTGVHDGYVKEDQYQDVSHLDFCITPKGEPLTATKTAVTSYTRAYTWDITKGPDGEYWKFIGDPAWEHDYDIFVDQTVEESLFKVYGTITVYNTNAFAVNTTVSDSVGGVAATINCGGGDGDITLTVPASGNASCSYYAMLEEKANGTNTATITSLHKYVEGTTASADYVFGDPTTVDGYPTVNVTDDKYGALGSASADTTFNVTGTFQCSAKPADYTNGVWTMTDFVNTATIDEIPTEYDSATVKLTCYAPVLDKTASASWEERYDWEITKEPDGTYEGFIGDAAFDHDYTVEVDLTKVPQNFLVEGFIYVTNPAGSPGSMTVSLADELASGVFATVDCGGGATSVTVPTGETKSCSYSGYLTAKTDGTNTATGTFNKIDFETTEAYAFGAAIPVGFTTINVTDDKYGELGPASDDKTFSVTGSFQCSANKADYTNGVWTMDDFVNTASIDQIPEKYDSATVKLTCYAPLISKTANGEYDEVYDWQVTKTVSPASQTAWAGVKKNFTWTVKVDKIFSHTENYLVTGVITVVNPNPEDALIVELSDALDDGSVATIGPCTFTPTPPDGTLVGNVLTVPKGATASCDYSVVPQGDLDAIEAALPPQVTFKVQYPVTGGDAYFPNVTITGGTVLDGIYDGWCIDQDHTIANNTNYTANVYSSYEDLPAGLVEKPYNFDLVNWIINQDFVGKDAGGGLGYYTYGDVQYAIWKLIDDGGSTSGLGSYNPTRATQIITAAQANGEGFEPTCGDFIAVVLQPTDGSQAITIAQVTFFSLGVDCAASNVVTAVLNEIEFPASAEILWTANKVNDTAMLDDEQNPAWPEAIEVSDDGTFSYQDPQGYTCSSDPAAYVVGNGSYQYSESNTALLTWDAGSDDSTATTVVKCYAPVVSKDAAGTYDERHEWDVDKTVFETENFGFPGDVLDWTWTVNVTETVFEENFAVTGNIYVANPAGSPGSMTVKLTDKLSDDFQATITGCTDGTWDSTAKTVVVAKGVTATCAYTANPTYTDDLNAATSNIVSYELMVGSPHLMGTTTANIAYTANQIRENASLTDDLGPLDESLTGHAQAGTYTFGPFEYDGSHTCSTNRADYFVDGVYTQGSWSITNWADVYSDSELQDSDDATTTYTCDASFVDILKTTNGAVDPSKDIRFKLYDGTGVDLNDEVSTFGDADGQLQFQTALVPGDKYTVCEAPVPAGYTFEITVDGGNVLTYAGPPGAVDPTGEIQCFDFFAADEPTTLLFYVNNRYPGGAPRTPGYWKNWNTCSGGNQQYTAAALGGAEAGVFLLDDLLPQTIGTLTIESCEDGVAILSAMTIGNKPKNMASDAAYTLARALLAARLNQDAGACIPMMDFEYKGEILTFEQFLTKADELLAGVGFNGEDPELGPKVKGSLLGLRNDALYLYEIIDDYNNSELCTGEYSH